MFRILDLIHIQNQKGEAAARFQGYRLQKRGKNFGDSFGVHKYADARSRMYTGEGIYLAADEEEIPKAAVSTYI